ncbi:MAG: GNAT family N-acetyltransferase [Caulobacteraceae bacterium]
MIRRAGPQDCLALADIGRRTFTETFGHIYPPEDLAHFLAQTHTAGPIAAELTDPAYAHWLVERGGEVIGYALAGACDLPHADVRPGDGELKRFYLLGSEQGQGTGSRLLAEVFEWLLEGGPRTLWIGVFSENLGAQRLYGRHGFEKVGTYDFIVGGTRDHEFILRRDKSQAPPRLERP